MDTLTRNTAPAGHGSAPSQRAPDTTRYFSRGRAGSRAQALIVNLLIVLVPIAVYYITVIQRQEQHVNERAFRALKEMQQAFDNYMASVAGLSGSLRLNTVPKELFEHVFAPEVREPAAVRSRMEAWLPYLVAVDEQGFQDFDVRTVTSALCRKATDGATEPSALATACRSSAGTPRTEKEDIAGVAKAAATLKASCSSASDASGESRCEAIRLLADMHEPAGFVDDFNASVGDRSSKCDLDCWREIAFWFFIDGDTEVESVGPRGPIARILDAPALDGIRVCPVVTDAPIPSSEPHPFYECRGDGSVNEAVLDIGSKPAVLVMPCKSDAWRPRDSAIQIFEMTRTRDMCRSTSTAGRETLAARLEDVRKLATRDGTADRLTVMFGFQAWRPVGYFQHMEEFDHVIVASDDGLPLATEGDWHTRAGERWSAQEGISGIPTYALVRELLGVGATDGWSQQQSRFAGTKDSKGIPEKQLESLGLVDPKGPGRAVQFRHKVGSTSYQVFVLPYRPSLPMFRRPTEVAGQYSPVQALYFIGMRQTRALTLPAGSFDPLAAWLLVASIAAGLLLVPSLRLWLLETRDSIGRLHGRLAALGALGAAALLSVLLLSMSGYRSLVSEAESRAAVYAERIRAELYRQLDESLNLLVAYRGFLNESNYDGRVPIARRMQRSGDSSGDVAAPWVDVSSSGEKDELCSSNEAADYWRLWEVHSPDLLQKNWSPMNAAAKVESDGRLGDILLTAFQCQPPMPQQPLDAREYFRAFRDKGAWHWPPPGGMLADALPCFGLPDGKAECEAYTGEYIAQRLFNRRDGARVVQLAIPGMPAADSDEADFPGLITGDASFYPLTAAVLPPDFSFVVFDTYSGSVVFHGDDSRALVENFYTETEDNPELAAAVRSGTATPFTGEYRGHPHGFHYLPVPGTTWGVAVVYPLRPLRAVVLNAGLVSLLCYASAGLIAIALLSVALSVTRRRLTWAWPQWRLRHAYGSVEIVLIGFIVMEVAVLSLLPRGLVAPLSLFLLLFVPCAGFGLLAAHPISREPLRWWALVGALAIVIFVMAVGVRTAVAGTSADSGAVLFGLLCAAAVTARLLLWSAERAIRAKPWTPRLFSGRSIFGKAALPSATPAIGGVAAIAAAVFYLPGWPIAARLTAGVLATAAVILLLILGWMSELRMSLAGGGEQDVWSREPAFADSGTVQEDVRTRAIEVHRYRRGYYMCVLLCVIILSAIPAGAFYLHAHVWQVDAMMRVGLARTSETIVDRYWMVRRDLGRRVPDDALRKSQFPDPWVLATLLPAPGIDLSAGQGATVARVCVSSDLGPESSAAGGDPCVSTASDPASGADLIHFLGTRLTGGSLRSSLLARLVSRAAFGTRGAGEHRPVVAPDAPGVDGVEVIASASALQYRGVDLVAFAGQTPQGALQWPAWVIKTLMAIGWLLPVAILIELLCRRLVGLGTLEVPASTKRRPVPKSFLDWLRHADRVGHAPRLVFLDFDPLEEHMTPLPGSPDWLHADVLGPTLYGAFNRLFELGIRTQFVDLSGDAENWKLPPQEPYETAVWLSHFDSALLRDADTRGQLLTYLERLVARADVRLFVSADLSPVGLLTRPSEYPQESLLDVSREESARWGQVFGQLRPVSLTAQLEPPEAKDRPGDADPEALAVFEKIERECRLLWPRLETLRDELHHERRIGRITALQQVEERVSQHAEAFFARMWRHCSVGERLALYQLARGTLPSPDNAITIERLHRRGLVECEPAPQIASIALRRFVLSAELPEVFSRWQEDAASGVWQRVRTPIVLVLLLLIAWLAHSAGQVFQALAAILTSAAVFAGNALSIFNMTRNVGGGK